MPAAHKSFHFYFFLGYILFHTTTVFVFQLFLASTDYWVAVITLFTKKAIDVFNKFLWQNQVVNLRYFGARKFLCLGFGCFLSLENWRSLCIFSDIAFLTFHTFGTPLTFIGGPFTNFAAGFTLWPFGPLRFYSALDISLRYLNTVYLPLFHFEAWHSQDIFSWLLVPNLSQFFLDVVTLLFLWAYVRIIINIYNTDSLFALNFQRLKFAHLWLRFRVRITRETLFITWYRFLNIIKLTVRARWWTLILRISFNAFLRGPILYFLANFPLWYHHLYFTFDNNVKLVSEISFVKHIVSCITILKLNMFTNVSIVLFWKFSIHIFKHFKFIWAHAICFTLNFQKIYVLYVWQKHGQILLRSWVWFFVQNTKDGLESSWVVHIWKAF